MRFLRHVFVSLALFTSTAFAHPGGRAFGPPASRDDVKKNAATTLGKLVENGKLDKTWKDLAVEDPTPTDVGMMSGWVVTVKNPKAAEKDKQKLYIFLSPSGEPIGANFTGN